MPQEVKLSIDTPGHLLPTLHNLKVFSFRTASRLRTVIDRFGLKKGGIPRRGIRSRFAPGKEMEGQEDMIVETRPVRRIGRRANQVKFGMQPNGTLFTVAMSPTNIGAAGSLNVDDYGKKGT